MNFTVRDLKQGEVGILKDFLYEAFYVPVGSEPFSKDIIDMPEHRIYFEDFYSKKDDVALVAEIGEEIVGCVWVRVMEDYGHINDDYPSLSISVFKDYQNYGIGNALMKEMIKVLHEKGYPGVSLSVQKENYASKLYEKLGFEVYQNNGDDWVMMLKLVKNE